MNHLEVGRETAESGSDETPINQAQWEERGFRRPSEAREHIILVAKEFGSCLRFLSSRNRGISLWGNQKARALRSPARPAIVVICQGALTAAAAGRAGRRAS